jgi:hypothetical protein
MTDQTITCPHCGKEIPLTETLFRQVEEDLRKEFEAQLADRLKTEKELLKQEARKEVEADLGIELKDLQEQNTEKERKLDEARAKELETRKKMRNLEDQAKNAELEMARKLDEERGKIREQALEIFSEEHRLKDLEKEKKIADMIKQIEDLKRKAEQGSMQTQGEVLELDLEASLRARFPADAFEPVPKGMRGADIVQRVHSRLGQCCGTILWETKRTKAWSDGWIEKLKDDQREMAAECAIIVSEVLPKEVSSFSQMDGVWVTSPLLAYSLVEVIRDGLIQLSQTKLSAVGKNEKMEVLYNYLSGPGFKQKIEAIVGAFKSMKEELDHEKRAMTKIWAKREKEIQRVVGNIASMHGDLHGIIGASLPQIKMLELSEGEEEELEASAE